MIMKITEETMKQQNSGQSDPASQAHNSDTRHGTTVSTAAPAPTEREKLKAMNRKDKLWYIWTYYKLHIFGVTLAVLMASAVGNVIYSNSFKTELHCMFLNNRSEHELNTAPLEQDFAAYLKLGKKQKVTTESTFISFGEEATEFSYASMAKISALLAAKELDIIIGDTESLNHYASMGGFLNLEASLSPDVLSLVQDRLYYTDGEDGSSRAYAIDLSGTAFAEDSNLALDPPLLGIIVTSTHTDNVERLIQYIFAP